MGSSDISIVLNMPVGEEFGKKAGRSDEIYTTEGYRASRTSTCTM